MRLLKAVEEFQREAPNALFTKEQALQISLKLLLKELKSPETTPEDAATIKKAIEYFNFQYLDQTKSETDAMLDAFGVARLTTEDIANGISNVLFDAD